MKSEKFMLFLRGMIHIYLKKRVSRSAAELAYFLTISIFPMLICLYAMLGNLFEEIESLLINLSGFIPADTAEIFEEYLLYVKTHSSDGMLVMGLSVMATTSAAAFRSIHNIMADIQGLPRFRGIWFIISSFLFSLAFLAVIYFALIVLLTGSWFINSLGRYLKFLQVSHTWSWIRFFMLFAVLLFIIYGIYRFTAPKGTTFIMPGALAATAALVAVSVLLSWFIEISVKYSLIYGSLASIIIMMFWLYLCGIVLIMGNAFNIVIRKIRRGSSLI